MLFISRLNECASCGRPDHPNSTWPSASWSSEEDADAAHEYISQNINSIGGNSFRDITTSIITSKNVIRDIFGTMPSTKWIIDIFTCRFY